MKKKFKKINNKGFVLLFAIVLTAMVLAIALSVLSISFKEITFTTSAKSANDAFYAADMGAECALYWDKQGAFGNVPDPFNPSSILSTFCAGIFIKIDDPALPLPPAPSETSWNFQIYDLTGLGKSCADVTLKKINNGTDPLYTVITSNGYNLGDAECKSNDISRVERQIEINYED